MWRSMTLIDLHYLLECGSVCMTFICAQLCAWLSPLGAQEMELLERD